MSATGIGSLPGDDIDAAVALVFDALPDLPHLPELPARGPGADMVGRSAAALVDLHVDLQPAGWRLVARAGLDERRATELLQRDLDALVPVAAGYDAELKVQLAGPWTLAATVELPRGGRILGDAGATRDLAESLAATVSEHLAEVRRRVPAARLVLQLDEPALPAVLAGTIATASGLGRFTSVDPQLARARLQAVIAAAGDVPVVVHCCAADVPVALLRESGASAVSFDLAVASIDPDEVAEQAERGLRLWPGVVPATGPGVPPSVREVVTPLRQWWHRVGLADSDLAAVTVTPACGLAGASEGWARTALRLVAQASRVLREDSAVPR